MSKLYYATLSLAFLVFAIASSYNPNLVIEVFSYKLTINCVLFVASISILIFAFNIFKRVVLGPLIYIKNKIIPNDANFEIKVKKLNNLLDALVRVFALNQGAKTISVPQEYKFYTYALSLKSSKSLEDKIKYAKVIIDQCSEVSLKTLALNELANANMHLKDYISALSAAFRGLEINPSNEKLLMIALKASLELDRDASLYYTKLESLSNDMEEANKLVAKYYYNKYIKHKEDEDLLKALQYDPCSSMLLRVYYSTKKTQNFDLIHKAMRIKPSFDLFILYKDLSNLNNDELFSLMNKIMPGHILLTSISKHLDINFTS